LLWFYTFLLADRVKGRYRERRAADPVIKDAKQAARKRRRVELTAWSIKVGIALFALIPAWIFSLSMYHAYEPAVFVMALVAVYVAAEHYGGLVQTEQELHERTEDLMSTMGTVLDADGLNFWRAEIYALYLNATWRIDAVIRNFDIDLEWWKCATERAPWDHYVMRSAAKTGEYTLLHVMGASRAKVKFAVDMPLPMRAVSPECPEPEKGKFFRDLLGLAWYLVVFDLAFK
jgi:hypothetical protein